MGWLCGLLGLVERGISPMALAYPGLLVPTSSCAAPLLCLQNSLRGPRKKQSSWFSSGSWPHGFLLLDLRISVRSCIVLASMQ